ncbi:DUF927 domain-containing protein [Virgibacillus sp.]|uniref:DUF927 domain-containing protein n=1 Tax=Virgibacillus sp. TaxID=1872700 RepID=UPI0017C18472|nr:DUF927 domain-containing protein [Virgibacillus sp.]NWO14672.1 DUF927 domain-containing protein [Virgibacillus sp.]
MPGAKIIKLIGYSRGNNDYQTAKKAAEKWKDAESLNDDQINNWLEQGGWIGAVIPKGRYLIDVDDDIQGKLLKELLEGENIHHHAIKTPKGYHFIFKESEGFTQYQGYVNGLGLVTDARKAGSGYEVFPTFNTEGRYIVSKSLEQLDEPPHYLKKVWNGQKVSSPMAYPYETSGSRDGDFYDLARRLLTCGVDKSKVQESLELAYKYFVPYKEDFPLRIIAEKVNSAFKKVDGENNFSNKSNPSFQFQIEGEQKNVVIPKPFKIGSKDTLFEEKEYKDGNIVTTLVSRKTPYITKEFHNVERPQVFYEIQWNDRNRTVKEIVPASTIAIRKELLELSDRGFSVNENNVKKIITYFDRYLLANGIKQYDAVERLGGIKGRFIHPVLSNDIEIMAIDQGEKQINEGFEVKGTSETWKNEVFERIKQSPKAVFMVLASFASIVIKDLKVQPFIVDLSGTTSQGKTTTLRVAASVWGNENLLNEWNATRVSIERKAAYLNSYPLLLDDTRKANERVLKDIIYQFSGGRSKGRGSLKGSQREYTWNNILLSTGEVSLNEYAKNQGGAAARIIPLIDEPLKKDQDNIIQLYEGMENNYGAVGIDFLKVWQKQKKDLIPEYHNFRSHYIDKAKGNEVLSRLAGYYAAVHFTGSILNKTLGMDIDLKAISRLFDEIAEDNKTIDKPMQFLEEILTDLDSDRESILGRYLPRGKIKAIYKDKQKQLFLTPSYLTEFLGVEEKQTRKEWLKRGITVPVEKNGKTVDYTRVSHKGTRHRAIALNMDIVKELDFDFQTSEVGQSGQMD